MTPAERTKLLTLDDTTLLRGCEFIMRKGSGNGGQKVNKTSSSVRLRHFATGLAVTAGEDRSQARNRHTALQKLRFEIAAEFRADPPDPDFAPEPVPSPSNHERIVLWTAGLFDYLSAADWDLKRAAVLLGTTSTHLERAMRRIPAVWRKYAEHRTAASGPEKTEPEQ